LLSATHGKNESTSFKARSILPSALTPYSFKKGYAVMSFWAAFVDWNANCKLPTAIIRHPATWNGHRSWNPDPFAAPKVLGPLSIKRLSHSRQSL